VTSGKRMFWCKNCPDEACLSGSRSVCGWISVFGFSCRLMGGREAAPRIGYPVYPLDASLHGKRFKFLNIADLVYAYPVRCSIVGPTLDG
jgi:hypothetical protein